MGKIAAAIRELRLAEQPKRRFLALDKEFEAMESEIQRLKVENLSLQAQVNPVKRENEELKAAALKAATIKIATPNEDRLDPLCEAILLRTANDSEPVIMEDVIQSLSLSLARGQFFVDILEEKKFIEVVGGDMAGLWITATRTGRKYLATHKLI